MSETSGVTMRIAFLVVLLGGAVLYSYIAFAELAFMTRTGRLGPGFFPRIIGVTCIAVTCLAMLDALRDRRRLAAGLRPAMAEPETALWRDAVTLMALALGYAVLMRLFGGFISTIIYLGAALSVMNPGRHLQNAAVALLLPVGVYLLFDRLLNANMPPALIALPF